MDWLFLAGIVIFLIGLMVSIALHEIGHLVPAKLFGVRVTQYMVGFGSTVWSRRKGETEYGIKWIPLGGYIRMIGMLPPRPGDDPSKLGELDRPVPGPHRRPPVRRRRKRSAGRRGPGLLPQEVVAEGHHHVRRPGDELRAGVRAVHDRARGHRRAHVRQPIVSPGTNTCVIPVERAAHRVQGHRPADARLPGRSQGRGQARLPRRQEDRDVGGRHPADPLPRRGRRRARHRPRRQAA